MRKCLGSTVQSVAGSHGIVTLKHGQVTLVQEFIYVFFKYKKCLHIVSSNLIFEGKNE